MKKHILSILLILLFVINSLSAVVINTDKLKIRCAITSADGEWTFINALTGSDNDFRNCIFALSSYDNYAPQLIYESSENCDEGGIGNLCYSDKNQKLYFSVETTVEHNGIWLGSENGFYTCEKDTSGFYTRNTVKRYRNFTAEDMNLGFRAFIKNQKEPDFTGYLNYIFTFADAGSNPVFYIQDDNGNTLYDEDALKYLCCSKGKVDADRLYAFVDKHKEAHKFPLSQFVLDKNHGLEAKVSAISGNGQQDFCNSDFDFKNWCYFAKNDKGIWIVNQEGYPGHEYGKVYLFEDESGRFCLSKKSALKDVKALPPKARFVAGVSHGIWYNNSIEADGKNLIIRDEDGTGLWYYDSETRSEDYFETRDELEAYKKECEERNSKKLAVKSNIAFLIIIIIVAVLLAVVLTALAVLLIFKIKKSVVKAKIEKAEQTKNRNRFIFAVQEKERAKISRDIHDSVVQDIRVIRLETENLEVQEKSKEKQLYIQNVATDCISKLRNICYNLQPAEIYTHSDGDSSKIELISIINTLSQQFIARTHIPCAVKVEDDFEYPVFNQEVTENLFRTVQEALNNIEKHSYATNVSIFFKIKSIENKNNLVIYISDDGVGCNLETVKQKNKDEHRGLRNMQQRMELIGGSMELFSNPNEGMEIKLILPLER